MNLVDSSAWVEYLRGTGSTVHLELRRLIAEEADLAVTELVVMEVLAGARSEQHADLLRRMLLRCTFFALDGLDDFEEAAALYRTCRRASATVRRLPDCLIAAVAIRNRLPILHWDRDFNALAQHTALEVSPGSMPSGRRAL